MPSGSTKHKLAFKGAKKMGNLQRYVASDLGKLMDQINRNAIGMDGYFDRLFDLHETTQNYPPYNLVQLSNVESRLEIALAGFKKDQVHVYTEFGKLFIEGQREDGESQNTYAIVALLKGLSPAVGHSLMILR